MIKWLLCMAGGTFVGMMLNKMGVADPIPPIVAGVVACVLDMEVRKYVD